jgi:hypothetical protein
MKQYVKPEITVKEYRVSEDIATLAEYYYSTGENNGIKVSLFATDVSGTGAVNG